MATTSFAKAKNTPLPDAPEEDALETNTNTALAERPSTVANYTAAGDGVEGDFDRSDFITPRLNLVGKTGELSDLFTPGTFVFDKEVQLNANKDEAIAVVICNMSKTYMQDLPFGSEERPKIFRTAREVRENNGGIGWDCPEDVDKYNEVLDLTVLVRGPKDHPKFPFELNGENYALAKFSLGKSAYRVTGRQIFTDSQTSLKREGITSRTYHFTSRIQSNAMGSWYVPIARLGEKTSQDVRDLIADING